MTLQEYKEKRLQDPKFAEAYEEVTAEMEDLRTKIDVENCIEGVSGMRNAKSVTGGDTIGREE